MFVEIVSATARDAVGGRGLGDEGVGGLVGKSFGKVGRQVDPHGGDDASGVGDPSPGEDEGCDQGDEGHHQGHHKEQRRARNGITNNLPSRVSAVDLAPYNGKDHHQHVGERQRPEKAGQRPPQDSGHAGQEVNQAGNAEEGKSQPINQGVNNLQNDKAYFGDEHHPQSKSVVDGRAEQVIPKKLECAAKKSPFTEKTIASDALAGPEGVNLALKHIHQKGIFDPLQFQGLFGRFHGNGHTLVVKNSHTGEQNNGNKRPFEQSLGVDVGCLFNNQGNHEHAGKQAHEKEAIVLHERTDVQTFD